MKIVVVVMSYYPHEGGVQTVTKYLAEGLARRGHDITIMTARKGDEAQEEVYHQVKMRRFDVSSFLKIIPKGETKAFKDALLSACEDADVLVNVCGNTPLAVLTYQVISQIKCRKILHQHGMFDGKFHFQQCHTAKDYARMLLLTPFWELFHRYYWGKISLFDACIHLFEDDSSHRYFKRRGFQHNHVVMNSCETLFFDGLTDKTVPDKYHIRTPYYIYVANYSANKNQVRAVSAFMKSGCSNMELVLVGSSPNHYYSKVRALIDASPCRDRIHLLAAIPREDTISLIKNAYASLLTSRSEYFPITLIEGMACGKPFISTDVGVVRNLPGGVVCKTDHELAYWLRYDQDHFSDVTQQGALASEFARSQCYLPHILDQVEAICKN